PALRRFSLFRTRLLAPLAAAGVVTGLLIAAHPAQAAAPQLTAQFSQTSTWSNGYNGSYTVTNAGAAASTTWVVEFDLPSGSTVSKAWNATLTQTGQHFKLANVSY